MSSNPRSDVAAKVAYAAELESRGFEEVEIVNSPSDIIAVRDGELYYFEIKFTNKTKRYFGAATLTEWEAAILNEGRFLICDSFQKRKGLVIRGIYSRTIHGVQLHTTFQNLLQRRAWQEQEEATKKHNCCSFDPR